MRDSIGKKTLAALVASIGAVEHMGILYY